MSAGYRFLYRFTKPPAQHPQFTPPEVLRQTDRAIETATEASYSRGPLLGALFGNGGFRVSDIYFGWELKGFP